MKIQYICQLCSQDLKYAKTLRKHINENHKEVDEVEYYLKYLAKDKEENLCKVCRKPLRTDGKRFSFLGFRRPFHRGCVQTEKYYVIKYGEELGKQKWQEYRKIQGKTNSLEYKKEKYGMTEEEFKEYNKSRAVTLKNLTKKYGEEEGKRRFEIYREKQKTAGITLEYFIKTYGKEIGEEKYKKMLNKKTFNHKHYSEISKKLFDSLKIKDALYAENEYFLIDDNGKFFKYDYTILKRKKIIEFQGEHFHPKSIDDKNFKSIFKNDISTEEIFKRDQTKKILAEKNGFKVLYIWEYEYKNDEEKTIKKCLEFLNEIC